MFSSSSGNPAGGGDEAAGRGGIGVLGGIGGAPDGDGKRLHVLLLIFYPFQIAVNRRFYVRHCYARGRN